MTLNHQQHLIKKKSNVNPQFFLYVTCLRGIIAKQYMSSTSTPLPNFKMIVLCAKYVWRK